MFTYQQNKCAECLPCPIEIFKALTQSADTANKIDRHRGLKACGRLEEAKNEKDSLPGILYQTKEVLQTVGDKKYNKGRLGHWRLQSQCVLNGLVMCDFDHVENPKEKFFEVVKELWSKGVKTNEMLEESDVLAAVCKELDIVLAFVTPGGEGLKTVSIADINYNLVDNQKRLAKMFGLSIKIDKGCKDSSRLSYIPKWDDILYIDEERLFGYDNPLYDEKYGKQYREGNSQGVLDFDEDGAGEGHKEIGVTHEGQAPSDVCDDHRCASPCVSDELGEVMLDENEDGVYCYHGVAYKEILEKWNELKGGRPGKGDRHQRMLELGGELRRIVDNRPANVFWMMQQMDFYEDFVKEGRVMELQKMAVDVNEGSVPHMDYTCITRGCLIGVRPLKIKEYTCDGEDLYTKNPNELSKKMFRTLDEMGKTPIYRGFDHIPDEMLKELEVNYIDEGFVNLKMCGEHGFDPKYHRFEVPRDKTYPPDASAVQMPGLAVDENFMTTVPGIFAIGDAVSCVGAVMSAIVTGYTVGDLMGTYLDSVTGEIEIDEAQAEKSVNIIKAPLEMDPETGVSPAEYECAIREYDERYIGIFKSKGKLEAGLRRLASLKREFADKIYASNAHYLMRALEARDIADMAEIIMTADMAREETRGFFNRADFQQMDPERTGKLTYIKNVDGKPVAEIKPAPKLKEELKNLPKLRVLFDENGDVVPDADVL